MLSQDLVLKTDLTSKLYGLGKKIYFIKDEGHIATKNLDKISQDYFSRTIEFSATPNLRRGQHPDVEITEEDAVRTKLIKDVEIVENEYNVEDALNKLEEIKEDYINLLGVNPCLIIQISNKDKAYEELSKEVFSALNKHQNLKWMLILDKDANCNTNDVFKAKKLPVSKWKNYAKENNSTIDVIIFKMVISEGWDIPRACMLCQVRNTHSEQLDKQVMGRVRRNPRLLDFENLSEKAQKLATTAWVWGMIKDGQGKSYAVKLYDEPTTITNELKVKTTRLKNLTEKADFNLNKFIDSQSNLPKYSNIFELYRKLNKCDENIKKMCYEYSDTIDKWWKFNDNLDAIIKEYNKYTCDYSKSMELVKDEQGNDKLVSFPLSSFYIDNENYVQISDWVWKRNDGKLKFSFDSDAEWSWASLLKDLPKNTIKNIVCRKNSTNEQPVLDGLSEHLPIKLLWGKNYPSNSEIKYEYYLDGVHSSYPDFIMMDSNGKIHIFEVKSVNKANKVPLSFDGNEYQNKVEELKKCYKEASKLTGHIFYLPVQKDDEWHITRYKNGETVTLTEEQFRNTFSEN